MKNNEPIEFSREDEILFDIFFLLKEEEQYQECLDILYSLKKRHKNNYTIYFLLGTIYFLSDDYKNSARYLGKTLTFKPGRELASYCLFISLMELGHSRLALKELQRFVSLKPPQLYKFSIQEMYQNIDTFQSKADQEIIIQVYTKWIKPSTIPKVARFYLHKKPSTK